MQKRKLRFGIILFAWFFPIVATAWAQQGVDEASLKEVHFLSDISFESTDSENLAVGPPRADRGWSTFHPDFVDVFSSIDEALHGSKSIRIEPTPQSKWASRAVNQLTPGKRYLFSANVKITGDNGTGVIFARDPATKTILGITRVKPEAYQSWQKLVVDFVAQSEEVVLYLSVRRNTGPAFYDLVKLQEADSVLGSGSFEDDEEQWLLGQNASIQVTESLLGEHSLVLQNSIESNLAYASRTILLDPTDNEKAFKLTAAIKTDPTLDAQTVDFFLNAAIWMVEPFSRMFGDFFVCNQETDWLDNPLDEIEITNRDVPDLEGDGIGFQIRVYSDDEAKFRDISAPLFYSKSNSFHEREFHFLVPQWSRKMVVKAVNLQSSSIASFDNIRLSAEKIPDNKYFHQVGSQHNPVEAPLPGSFLAPSDFEEIQSSVDQVADPLNPHYGKIVWVDSGRYHGPGIDLWSNVHLKMHPLARMTRSEDPVSPYGFAAGFFRSCNNSFPGTSPLHDIVVEGGRYLSSQKQGNAIALAANRVTIRNMTIPTWSRKGETDAAQYQISGMFLFGNDLSIHNNYVSGPTSSIESQFVFEGYDGIHIWGGRRASILNNSVRAGDDGIGLFPLTQYQVDISDRIPGHPIFPIHHFNYNISDIEVYNNRLYSHGARTIGLGLAFPRQQERRLTCQVKNIRIRNFLGKCGGGQALLNLACAPASHINDLPVESIPDSQVSNILIERGLAFGDFSIENQEDYHGRIKEYGIYIVSTDVGSFKDVQIRDVRVSNITTYGLGIIKATVDGIPNQNIDIRDCNFDLNNNDEPGLPHTSFFIHQMEPHEVNSDFESVNDFIGSLGIFAFR